VNLPLLCAAFTWNVALGMTHLLTPLYATSMGMGGLEIGLLLSLPVVLQLVLILAGGAFVDRLGGKAVALGSCAMLAAAGLIFIGASGFAMMFLAQVLAVVSRAIFWPAAWSLGSALPGNAGRQMGLLNSAVNAGQVIGIPMAGVLIVHAGFRWSYALMIVVALASLGGFHLFRSPEGPVNGRPRQTLADVFATYRMLLGKRTLHYSILCSYISAMPLSLTFSFYPILLLAQGFDADSAGVIVSFRAIGGIVAGFFVASWLRQVYGLLPAMVCTIGTGVAIALTSVIIQPVLDAVLMFALGMASTVMMLVFQMLVSEASGKQTRGSAMALGTIGGTLSNLTTPLIMGVLIDVVDVYFAFQVMAGLAVVCAFALPPLCDRARREAAERAPGNRI
jgi:MFS family permease